ncbi:unnamed protein product [Parnassius apollo]|uniref:(apollo) hypothetical protein n=1 Tax=Parnassius apollo TaxID=110799 RepID=A0A8S3YBJ4_PARAO|nr:unnamed protein product [Parnassius apollo]
MVVKLSVALYADVYPTLAKSRGRQLDCAAETKRQKMCAALPALVEDDSEVEVEQEHCHILRTEGLRRQMSVSPQRREKMRRTLVLPSLSEDEEP